MADKTPSKADIGFAKRAVVAGYLLGAFSVAAVSYDAHRADNVHVGHVAVFLVGLTAAASARELQLILRKIEP